MPGLSAGPASRRAPEAGGDDGGLRDRWLGPVPSRITIVPPGGRPISTPRGTHAKGSHPLALDHTHVERGES